MRTLPLTAAAHLVAYIALTAQRTVNLPPAATVPNKIIVVKDEAGLANSFNIIIDPNGTEMIDNSMTKAININYGLLRIYSNGINWFSY